MLYYNEINFGELLIWPFGSFTENRKIKNRQIVRYAYAIGISHYLIKPPTPRSNFSAILNSVVPRRDESPDIFHQVTHLTAFTTKSLAHEGIKGGFNDL